MIIFLFEYIYLPPCEDPEGDLRAFLWYDSEGNNIDASVSLTEGTYEYTHRVQDPYLTYGEATLTLELNEQNTPPTVSIAAINESDVGLNQIIVEGTDINLFGTITDEFNDVDGSETPGIPEDDIIYNWNYIINPDEPLTIDDSNPLNPIITSPSINDNSESKEISITLEAQDPFQALDGESSITEPIVLTIVNDNQAPIITSIDEEYEIIEGGSSDINYGNINHLITVDDEEDDTPFLVVINQSDIDSKPEYGNYDLESTTITPDENYYGEIVVPIRLNDGYTVSDTCYNCLSEIAELIIGLDTTFASRTIVKY